MPETEPTGVQILTQLQRAQAAAFWVSQAANDSKLLLYKNPKKCFSTNLYIVGEHFQPPDFPLV